MLAVFPQADLFALIDHPDEELRVALPRRARSTTFLQFLPRPRKWLQYYVPLMPFAVRRLDVSGYDIVISSSHAVAKGVKTGPHQLHLSYVHTPMRYAWDLRDEYLRAAGFERGLRGRAARFVLERLRRWDAGSAAGVQVLLANSAHVAGRIRQAYGRESEVLYPPVDTAAFPLCTEKEDFYLTVSRLQAYKRVDLIVEAFARLPERRLLVIGDGPERERLQSKASANVQLLGRLGNAQVRDHMQRARAFLFAGIEDFGIVMAEAQACGTPLVAFAGGGALEIAREDTGVLFAEQSADSLLEALRRFESLRFSPPACRANALRFDAARFRARFAEIVRASAAGSAG